MQQYAVSKSEPVNAVMLIGRAYMMWPPSMIVLRMHPRGTSECDGACTTCSSTFGGSGSGCGDGTVVLAVVTDCV
jgi:hypothetical protein